MVRGGVRGGVNGGVHGGVHGGLNGGVNGGLPFGVHGGVNGGVNGGGSTYAWDAQLRSAVQNLDPKQRGAANAWRKRHNVKYMHAHKLLGTLEGGYAADWQRVAVGQRTQEVAWNRFVAADDPLAQVVVIRKSSRRKVANVWRLEESAWRKRSSWSDSGDFYDTEAMYERAFGTDWSRALRSHGLASFILKHDDGDSDTEEEGEGEERGEAEAESGDTSCEAQAKVAAREERTLSKGEIVEVGEVMWKYHLSIYRAFDAYASIGASATSATFTHINSNAFGRFVEDCNLSEANSKTISKAHIDGLFIMVNAGEAGKSKRKGSIQDVDVDVLGGKLGSYVTSNAVDDDSRALNRQEFLQCLVRLAIMKHVQPGGFSDVSRALSHFFEVDILPNLQGTALHDANAFRRTACYTEEVDRVLTQHKQSLASIFAVYARGKGSTIGNKLASSLLSFGEWMKLMKDLALIDQEFTVREASLAFVWSRMRVIDDTVKKSKLRLENLAIEDFYEALTHVATMKALPTDEEIAAASAVDAGAFVLKLRENPAEYMAWAMRNAARWESEPRQSHDKCLKHLLTLFVRTMKIATSTQDLTEVGELSLNEREVAIFAAKHKGK